MVFENLDRLPPEEQELLLPLLTEGLDERGRRLVFTASEKAERKILDSLLRQIPIVLQIPSLWTNGLRKNGRSLLYPVFIRNH